MVAPATTCWWAAAVPKPTAYRVEQFAFGDGSVLSDAQVQGLVSAMAAFAPASSANDPLMSATAAPTIFDRSGGLAVQAM